MLRELRGKEWITLHGGRLEINNWQEVAKLSDFDPTYLPASGSRCRMSLQLQPVRVKTGSHDTDGQLVFADGFLVAVLVRLSEDHEEEAGIWFLETGFDGAEDRTQPKFADLDEAQEWIQHLVAGH